MIEGVALLPRAQIFDERGKIMKIALGSEGIVSKRGEVYASVTKPGVVKAWHLHRRMVLNYTVVVGELKVVLFDPRHESSSYGVLEEYFLSPENFHSLRVPPGIWNGFKCISQSDAILINVASLEHDASEIDRLPFDSTEIPYCWRVVYK